VRHQQVVAAAASNALTAQLLLAQVAQAAGCADVAAFRAFVQTRLKDALEVDAVRLLKVAPTTTATSLSVDDFTALCPQVVNLRHLPDAASRSLYGAKGKSLHSEAVLVLPDATGRPLAVLALASRHVAQFHAGQQTELAELFARALGALYARLT
jgi:uncharacterized protein YigA (DUF484 family)